MADVTVTYKGSTIKEMASSGNAAIKTAGKYCEADIPISYVKNIADATAIIRVVFPTGGSLSYTDGTTTLYGMGSSGAAVLCIPNAGTWTVTCTSGLFAASDTVTVENNGMYDLTLAYFSATINVTWPAGSTCTCSYGDTVLTAPDTSGSYSFAIPSAGTWTVSCTNDSLSASQNVVVEDQHSYSVALVYS